MPTGIYTRTKEHLRKLSDSRRYKLVRKNPTPIHKYERKNKKDGWVYLIESCDRYKIGSTSNIIERIKAYGTYNPKFRVRGIYRVFDCCLVEKQIHRTMWRKRIKAKEWFILSKREIWEVRSLLEGEAQRYNRDVLGVKIASI